MTPQTCVRCGIIPTWNQYWPNKPNCDGENHLLPPGQMPHVRCPECGATCPDDQRVAAGLPCAECASKEERFSYA